MPETPQCSFCGKTENEVQKLVGGPTAFICDECLVLCNDIIGEPTDHGAPDEPVPPAIEEPAVSEKRKRVTEQIGQLLAALGPRPKPKPACSFCGKGQDEVRKLVAGPTVYICEECVRRFSN